MLWGIDSDGWAQLWSGIFGSVIGAMAAAGVALLVLWLSNKHQHALAQDALAEQRRLARLALDAQSEQAATALEEQRKSLELQLLEQRAEASKERETRAMSELIAEVDVLRKRYKDGLPFLRDSLFKMESAALRWSLEIPNEELAQEVMKWPDFVFFLAMHAAEADAAFMERALANREETIDKLAEAFSVPLEEVTAALTTAGDRVDPVVDEQLKALRGFMGSGLSSRLAALSRTSTALNSFARARILALPATPPGLAEEMAEARRAIRATTA